MNALDALIGRVSAAQLVAPGPDAEQLQQILTAGASAPDHGRMQPWRFIVIEGDSRGRLGDVMAQSLQRREPAITQDKLDAERKKALRAPTIVVVAAVLRDNPKVPEVEQIIAAGAAAQNMLVAAHAMGLGGFWRTGPFAYDAEVKKAFGLSATDAIVATLYIGSVGHPGKPRRVDLDTVTVRW
jgi:nitroreductase